MMTFKNKRKRGTFLLSDKKFHLRLPPNLAAVSMHVCTVMAKKGERAGEVILILSAFLFWVITVLIKFIRTHTKKDIMMTKEPFKEHFSISSIRADQTEKNIK